jgi:hypothetical protein
MSALPGFSGTDRNEMNLQFAQMFMEKQLDKKKNSKLEAYEVQLYLKILIERKEF